MKPTQQWEQVKSKGSAEPVIGLSKSAIIPRTQSPTPVATRPKSPAEESPTPIRFVATLNTTQHTSSHHHPSMIIIRSVSPSPVTSTSPTPTAEPSPAAPEKRPLAATSPARRAGRNLPKPPPSKRASPSPSASPAPSPSPAVTPTPTASPSPVASPARSPSPSPKPSPSPSPSPSPQVKREAQPASPQADSPSSLLKKSNPSASSGETSVAALLANKKKQKDELLPTPSPSGDKRRAGSAIMQRMAELGASGVAQEASPAPEKKSAGSMLSMSTRIGGASVRTTYTPQVTRTLTLYHINRKNVLCAPKRCMLLKRLAPIRKCTTRTASRLVILLLFCCSYFSDFVLIVRTLPEYSQAGHLRSAEWQYLL